MIPMDKNKDKNMKNKTTLKWSMGHCFTAATQYLTPAVVKYLETKWSLGSINHKKYLKIADSVWLSLFMRDNE
jgi:hypothetical protein